MNIEKEILYSNLQTMTIEEYKKYLKEEELGYIKINRHPENENIVILNYTETTAFERRWNKETMSARGLILDLTNAEDNGIIYILAKPFDKFFNYGENLEYEKDIDFSRMKSVMEKMDGSMGVSYYFEGDLRFATRGSFVSEQAIKATEIWNNKYGLRSGKINLESYVEYPFTIIVEIIYADNRIVVDYKNLEDLVLLGINDIYRDDIDEMFVPCEWSLEGIKDLSLALNMPIAKQYNYSIDMMMELKKILSPNEEGFIIRFENDKRLKIKGDEYLHVHRLLNGVSDKDKFKAWATGEMTEYIMMLPEEFRPELEEFTDSLEKLKDSLYIMLQSLYEITLDMFPERKEFAININKTIAKEYRSFMFDAYKNGNISVDKIRKYIADNYIEYLEVINTWKN